MSATAADAQEETTERLTVIALPGGDARHRRRFAAFTAQEFEPAWQMVHLVEPGAESPGLCEALAAILSDLRAPYVLFLPPHVVPFPAGLRKVLALLDTAPEVACAQGRTLLYSPKEPERFSLSSECGSIELSRGADRAFACVSADPREVFFSVHRAGPLVKHVKQLDALGGVGERLLLPAWVAAVSLAHGRFHRMSLAALAAPETGANWEQKDASQAIFYADFSRRLNDLFVSWGGVLEGIDAGAPVGASAAASLRLAVAAMLGKHLADETREIIEKMNAMGG